MSFPTVRNVALKSIWTGLLLGGLQACGATEPTPPDVDDVGSSGTGVVAPVWTASEQLLSGGIVTLLTATPGPLVVDSVWASSTDASFAFSQDSRELKVLIPPGISPGVGELRIFSNARHVSRVLGEFHEVVATTEDAVFIDAMQSAFASTIDLVERHATEAVMAAEDSTLLPYMAAIASMSRTGLDELSSLSQTERQDLGAAMHALSMPLPSTPTIPDPSASAAFAARAAGDAVPGRPMYLYTGERCRMKLSSASKMKLFNDALSKATTQMDGYTKALPKSVLTAALTRQWARASKLSQWLVEMYAFDIRLSTATLLVPRPADMGGSLTFRDRVVTAEGGRAPIDPIVLLVRRGPPWTDLFLATASSVALKRLSKELSLGVALYVASSREVVKQISDLLNKSSSPKFGPEK